MLAALWAGALSCNKKKNLDNRTQLDEPVKSASGGDQLLLYKILHLLFFPLVQILCCSMPWESKKIINMVLMRDLWNLSSFGRGDVSPTHSELCRFVLGVMGKTPGHISHNNFVKRILSASATAIMSSLCSGVKDCVTKRAHNYFFPESSVRIRRTTVLGMFKDSAIILDAIRLSFLTRLSTAAMFTSVQVDFGQPPLSSSSTSSLPPRNREYQLKTFDRFTASFP